MLSIAGSMSRHGESLISVSLPHKPLISHPLSPTLAIFFCHLICFLFSSFLTCSSLLLYAVQFWSPGGSRGRIVFSLTYLQQSQCHNIQRVSYHKLLMCHPLAPTLTSFSLYFFLTLSFPLHYIL